MRATGSILSANIKDMEKLRIRLLGQVRVSLASGQDVRVPTRKAEALLMYLASPPGTSHSRDHLAGLLWGRSGDPQARSSLRQHLSRLRKALGTAGDAILADAHSVTLSPEAVDIDVRTFEALIGQGDPVSLASAADLLGGAFAPGFAINEDAFEEWLRIERRRLAELSIAGLATLLLRCEDAEEHEKGAVIARKLLSVDPLQEGVHRSLMRCLVQRFIGMVQAVVGVLRRSCQPTLSRRRALGCRCADGGIG